MKRYFVYIMANKRNGTIYVGSTSNLIQRVWWHKNNAFKKAFTAQYGLRLLVYYEEHLNVVEMVRRENRLKNWCRKWKMNEIEKLNPTWRDLYEEIIK